MGGAPPARITQSGAEHKGFSPIPQGDGATTPKLTIVPGEPRAGRMHLHWGKALRAWVCDLVVVCFTGGWHVEVVPWDVFGRLLRVWASWAGWYATVWRGAVMVRTQYHFLTDSWAGGQVWCTYVLRILDASAFSF